MPVHDDTLDRDHIKKIIESQVCPDCEDEGATVVWGPSEIYRALRCFRCMKLLEWRGDKDAK